MSRGWDDYIASVARTPEELAAEAVRPCCSLCRKPADDIEVSLVGGHCQACLAWAAEMMADPEEGEP